MEAGMVEVSGLPTPRAATLIDSDSVVRVRERDRLYVSRGGEKLDGALRSLDVPVAGRRWLDAGASTGGFTDRLLQGGAAAVAAIDVGYGQFAWKLREDDRVFVLERKNVRDLAVGDLPWRPEAAVADLSFISLRLVLPVLARIVAPEGDHVLLVKPQFEVGKGAAGRGVVRDPDLWKTAIRQVVTAAASLSLGLQGVAASPLAGPAGNREFFVHLKREGSRRPNRTDGAIDAAILAAVEEAP